jgi:DNA primase
VWPCAVKAEELQKQIEAAKEDQEAAMKAQFDLAALLRSQREKYEETINKLCNELGETRVKLQLSEEQKQQLEQEHDHQQQEQHQQHEQQMQAAAATNTQVQEVSQPSATEPSPEMIQKIRDECAAEFFETLQALETDLNCTFGASVFIRALHNCTAF